VNTIIIQIEDENSKDDAVETTSWSTGSPPLVVSVVVVVAAGLLLVDNESAVTSSEVGNHLHSSLKKVCPPNAYIVSVDG
jgi:hypothetical protein